MAEDTKLQVVPSELSGVLRFNTNHDVESFDCGKETSNIWLKKYGLINDRIDRSRVHVICRSNKVVGYYSLTSSEIRPEIAFSDFLKGLPRKAPVPAVLLGQLAVDKSEQGKGLGKSLLFDALKRCLVASDQLAIRAVFVHAIDEEAKKFYLQYGFQISPLEPFTLMILLQDIRLALVGRS